jgi:hypothetical protein
MQNDNLKHETPTDANNVLVAGWISVNDRLPETNCDVLVAKTNGRVFQMSYHAPFDSGKRIFQWWGFGKWVDQHSQVTHWMPLPSPPPCR